MTISDVIIQYEGRLSELQTALAPAHLRNVLAVLLVAAALGTLFALSISAMRKQTSFFWIPLPVPVAAGAAWALIQSRRSRYRAWRLKRFYERGLQRVNGEWAGGGITGEEFADANHPYAADLNLFGEGSLFELLCIGRTSIGERGLANFLLETPTLDETLLRQDAVRELRARLDLREKVATLGEFEFCESKWATFDEWLKLPAFSFPRFLRIVMAVTSALLAALVLALFGGIGWTKVAIFTWPLIGLHAIIGAYFRKRTSRMLAEARPLSTELQVLREGLSLLESEQFQSVKLRCLVNRIQHASSSLKKLERLVNAIHQRDKEWFFLPSRALLVGTQLCPAIEQWRRKHGEPLRLWIAAWAEFEALNALAAYSYENPDNPFPDLSDGEPCFEAHQLAHPLLPRGSVANDVQLNPRAPFISSADRICPGKARYSGPSA